MAPRTPKNVDGTHFDGGWLRITWQDDTGDAGTAPTGFKVWWDDTSVPAPTWTVPPAADNGLYGGDGGSPVQEYSVMIYTPTSVVCWWETFDEYPTGVIGTMAQGGPFWDGPWSNIESVIGYKGYGDDFESYPVGVQVAPMNGGSGFDGAWVE